MRVLTLAVALLLFAVPAWALEDGDKVEVDGRTWTVDTWSGRWKAPDMPETTSGFVVVTVVDARDTRGFPQNAVAASETTGEYGKKREVLIPKAGSVADLFGELVQDALRARGLRSGRGDAAANPRVEVVVEDFWLQGADRTNPQATAVATLKFFPAGGTEPVDYVRLHGIGEGGFFWYKRLGKALTQVLGQAMTAIDAPAVRAALFRK